MCARHRGLLLALSLVLSLNACTPRPSPAATPGPSPTRAAVASVGAPPGATIEPGTREDPETTPEPDLSLASTPEAVPAGPTRTPIPGGLPRPNTAQSPQELCQTLASNHPEDRSRPDGTSIPITLATTMIDRFQAANLAMGVLRDARSTEVVRCASQVTLDVLVGPSGRHSGGTAYSPGMLPSDRPTLFDPGIALAAYDFTTNERVKSLITGAVLGDADRWRSQPSSRWDEIDAAVQRGASGISALDGRFMRLIARAVLAQQTSNVSDANQIGESGVIDSAAGLDAARAILQALCGDEDDPRCS